MARQPNHQDDVRKLTKLGGTSLGVIIPIDIIRSLGWRERQKVRITQKGSRVVIEDWVP
jgi:antitoxin component of MazEF toxin-antitoxin module